MEKSALFACSLTSFMSPFTIAAINVALPAIEKNLGMNAVQLSWLSTAYLLAIAVFLVPAGRLADIYGRKKVFTIGLFCFTIASTLAAFVPSAAWLIASRVFQGIGAALYTTTGIAILTSVFPPDRRGRAIGIYVSAVYLGLSLGPFIGGIMTQHLGWHSLFLILLPMGAATIWVTLRYLKGEWTDARGERLDWLGSLLYGAAIVLLVFGATRLPDTWAVLLIIAAVIGLVLFVWQEKRIDYPVFDVSLFQTNRTFTFSSMAALIHYSATFAITFLLSLYLQYIKGLQPQVAGTLLVAQPVVMVFFSPLAGRWSDRIQPRFIASTGMAITALGLAFFIIIGHNTPLWLIVADLVMLGFGFALFSSPNMNAIMGSVEKRYYSLASGTVATMRLLGQMASMATATVILSMLIGQQAIEPSNYNVFISCVHYNFIIFTGLCAIGIYFSYFRSRQNSLATDTGPDRKVGPKENTP
jgi:EmrB/QacA subfamily drug resistance transporter